MSAENNIAPGNTSSESNGVSVWKKVLIHIVFWCIFLSIPTIFNPRRVDQGASKFIYDLLEPPRMINGLFLIAVFYFNTLIAIPRFYFRHKYHSLATCTIVSLVFFYAINNISAPKDMHFARHMPLGNSFNLFMFIIVYACSFLICLYQQYQRIKEERLNTRISFLTAQINPHFLFNTLNSIHSLSLIKSDKVSDAIVKLSAIMRYSIGEGSQSMVPLIKEINYIQDYISLQKLRLTDEVTVNLNIGLQNEQLLIAPYLIIPFVENAFKHGVNGENDSAINIVINMINDQMNVQIQNDIVPTRERAQGVGLGIKTTQQRLELLYPGRHKLDISTKNSKFTVKLHLDLK